MGKISAERKTERAIELMRNLNLYIEAIRSFEKDKIIMVSEPPLGGLFWLQEDEKEKVKEIEEKYHLLVYHAVRSYMEFGECLSLFFVSDHEEEWAYDDEDIADNVITTYTLNLDDDICSEFGTIGFKAMNGGLIRVG